MDYTKGEWRLPEGGRTVYKGTHEIAICDTVENAQLIASAPDGYEANKVALAFICALMEQDPTFDNDYRVQMVKTTLEQALAKAGGR